MPFIIPADSFQHTEQKLWDKSRSLNKKGEEFAGLIYDDQWITPSIEWNLQYKYNVSDYNDSGLSVLFCLQTVGNLEYSYYICYRE